MELQDTYATVYNNTICVNNTAEYVADNYAYGISYCQSTSGSHYYDIYDNNVKVINGDYAVYLIDGASGQVLFNELLAIGNSNVSGDNSVFANRLNVYVDYNY